MNLIFDRFKLIKCIIAGVYHPYVLGFRESQVNTFSHYSEFIDPNDIAFTHAEVKKYYSEEF